MFNPVSKNSVSVDGCGSSSKSTTPKIQQKHPEMVQEVSLDCSGAASDDLDLNHTHNLWRELKTAHGGLPSNIEELEQFTAKKWDKLPVEKCSKVIDGYKKHLLAVLLANGCATKYQLWVANNFVHFLHVFIFENLIVNLSLQK